MARVGVGVIGAGTWGLALAAAAARTDGPTLLYSRRALDGSLPRGVKQASSLGEIGERTRIVFFAVPSGVAREVARSLGDAIDGRHYVIHGVRGLAGDGMTTISEILRQETPARRLGALGGPAVADDLLAGKPGIIVCGSRFPEVNDAVCAALVTPQMRIYTSDDLCGVEWASALVGCLAIGVGYAQGIGLSPGLMAAVTSRSVHEAARLAAAAGGEARTLLGLAGYGDLLASISQPERPEVTLGEALAKGQTLEDALAAVKQRVEAVDLIPRVVRWAERRGVRAPIFTALARGVFTRRAPEAIMHELMTGPIEDSL
jgi:glycerol-3-phosphate dehydrogenase (NAD(P)+)